MQGPYGRVVKATAADASRLAQQDIVQNTAVGSDAPVTMPFAAGSRTPPAPNTHTLAVQPMRCHELCFGARTSLRQCCTGFCRHIERKVQVHHATDAGLLPWIPCSCLAVASQVHLWLHSRPKVCSDESAFDAVWLHLLAAVGTRRVDCLRLGLGQGSRRLVGLRLRAHTPRVVCTNVRHRSTAVPLALLRNLCGHSTPAACLAAMIPCTGRCMWRL